MQPYKSPAVCGAHMLWQWYPCSFFTGFLLSKYLVTSSFKAVDLRLHFTWEWPVFPLQEQPNQVNYGNICTGLEVLNFLLTVLQSPAILSSFKPLQRGIAACMTCGNTKVLRAVHSLLSRLMSIFPTEPSKQPSRHASPLPEAGGPRTCLRVLILAK